MSDVKEEIMKKTAAEAAVEIQESEAAPDLNQAENSTPFPVIISRLLLQIRM